MIPTSCEDDDDDEVEPVQEVNQNNNNYYYAVCDSKSDDEENIFDEDINDELEANPKIAVNANMVQAMKKQEASYNDDANKIVKEVVGKKKSKIFVIDLAIAIVADDTKPPRMSPRYSTILSHEEHGTIQKEFDNMKKQHLWRKTYYSLMPPNFRCVQNK